jgi:hypothetical protein
MSRKPNTDYLETYFEVVAEMERRSEALYERLDGTGEKWELAKVITDEFERRYANTDWDNDPIGWLETLENFLNYHLKEFPINKTQNIL